MDLFAEKGAHVLVDGQFGSTGKGALAAWLAREAIAQNVEFHKVISNAGPNSGHTFYHGDEKVVLKQLPTFAVASYLRNVPVFSHLSAGAVIDYDVLYREAMRYPDLRVSVHPNAAVITAEDVATEGSGTIAAVAGTRSGTGAAIARKVMRDPDAVFGDPDPQGMWWHPSGTHRVFVEVSQGFSLGINQPFYPKCTSRECTVAQAISDAGIPPRHVTRTYMSIRTFPIRVGNVDGHSSGGWYPDQREIEWSDIGVAPELTTVTKRPRRIATFSEMQLEAACRANDPDFIFVNFLNYLRPAEQEALIDKVRKIALRTLGRHVGIIGGHGPTSDHIRILHG